MIYHLNPFKQNSYFAEFFAKVKWLIPFILSVILTSIFVITMVGEINEEASWANFLKDPIYYKIFYNMHFSSSTIIRICNPYLIKAKIQTIYAIFKSINSWNTFISTPSFDLYKVLVLPLYLFYIIWAWVYIYYFNMIFYKILAKIIFLLVTTAKIGFKTYILILHFSKKFI